MSRAAWSMARRQEWAISREQLLTLGFTTDAIDHRLDTGRLYPWYRGVYAVGRRHLTWRGQWFAAVLACGPGAALSHVSAGGACGMSFGRVHPVTVSVPLSTDRAIEGLVIRRRSARVMAEVVTVRGLPVTSPTCTLVDLAAVWAWDPVEAAVNEADKLDLIDPESLRESLERLRGVPGVARLRAILDRHTFTLTDSGLERRFKPIARAAGLCRPETGVWLDGAKVDFFWPELGLVIETDGLRYHRTPAQQAKDLVRDQTHTAAGRTPLRFSRAQVRFEPARVTAVLAATARRLRGG